MNTISSLESYEYQSSSFNVDSLKDGGMVLRNSSDQYLSSCKKKGKRKVQGVPQSQTAAVPRPQEEAETDKRRINHKATKNKTNTGMTALERSVK